MVDDGEVIWWTNDATGEAVWEQPTAAVKRAASFPRLSGAEAVAAAASARYLRAAHVAAPPGWSREDDGTVVWFVHNETGEAVWDLPSV